MIFMIVFRLFAEAAAALSSIHIILYAFKSYAGLPTYIFLYKINT